MGCDRFVANAQATEPAAHSAQPEKEKRAGHAEAPDGDSEGAHSGKSARFGVPFAWETSKDEPLAKTRAFLAEALVDNQRNVARGSKYFKTFADQQSPRATVITCSDSRVQSEAWDLSAENDDFIIRNIGNQLSNAEGSIEYGVEHLHTPVLLVVGHTGCGAVKAALGSREKLSAPIKKELEPLKLPESRPGLSEDEVWTAAVIANVNHQVELAVSRFGRLIQEGSLTVVGTVYDFRNDLHQGAGRLLIINVNSNTEPERLQAFQAAVTAGSSAKQPSAASIADDLKRLLAEHPELSPRRAHPSPE